MQSGVSGAQEPGREPGPTLLAIDCSSAQAGLAMFDGAAATELSWPAGRSQTTSLLAEIHHLLSLHELEPAQLGGVAVTIGPGAFSGLRVGLSVAKGLVLGLDLPIIGVPTLAAAALPYAGLGLAMVALVPAGRGRIVWSLFTADNGVLGESTPPRNGTLAELIEALPASGPVIVTGELTTEQAGALGDLTQVELAPVALRQRRPAAVATIGWDRLQRGEADDPASLQPLYAGRD